MPTRRRAEWAERAALVGAVASYVALSLLTLDQMEEDAYIYFRLARNLADGQGYVFNRGGEAVESGSSPLWLLLLVLLARLHVDLALGAKLLGIAIGALALLAVHALAREWIADRWLRLAPVLLTAWSAPFLMWNQRGLETPLYALVVLGLVYVCVDARRVRYWPLPAVALLLARPEAFLVLLPVAAALYLHREPWRRIATSLAVVALAALALTTARALYFGDALPHPFHTKMSAEAGTGWRSAHDFFRASYLYLFALPVLAVAWRRAYWEPRRILLLAFIAVLVLWSSLSAEQKPYHRHLAPALPPLFVLVVSSAAGLARPGSRLGAWLLYAYAAAFLAASSLLSAPPRPNAPGRIDPNPIARAAARLAGAPGAEASRLRELLRHPDAIDVTYQSLVGDFLRLNYPPGVVVAFDQMGKAPYRAGPDAIFIDTFGLTDRTIGYFYFSARASRSPWLRLACRLSQRVAGSRCAEPHSAQRVLDYVFGRRPDVILLNRYVMRRLPQTLPGLISRDPRLSLLYEPRWRLAGVISLYERKGLPSQPLRVPEGLEVQPLSDAAR
jgi:hypothetical protein